MFTVSFRPNPVPYGPISRFGVHSIVGVGNTIFQRAMLTWITEQQIWPSITAKWEGLFCKGQVRADRKQEKYTEGDWDWGLVSFERERILCF